MLQKERGPQKTGNQFQSFYDGGSASSLLAGNANLNKTVDTDPININEGGTESVLPTERIIRLGYN